MSTSCMSSLKLLKSNLLRIDWRGGLMQDWQILCWIFFRSQPAKRAGAEATAEPYILSHFCGRVGFVAENVSN